MPFGRCSLLLIALCCVCLSLAEEEASKDADDFLTSEERAIAAYALILKVFAVLSAPAPNKNSATFACPFSTAQWRAVLPSLSLFFTIPVRPSASLADQVVVEVAKRKSRRGIVRHRGPLWTPVDPSVHAVEEMLQLWLVQWQHRRPSGWDW